MTPEVHVAGHQDLVEIPEEWLTGLERAGAAAASAVCSAHAKSDDAPLFAMAELEVALVDDVTSARVHEDFMGVPGATDVITFDHGEIVIGVEVASRQAGEYGEPLKRELLRYLVHGLLHLAGHEDADERDRVEMERAQETIVADCWPLA